MEKLYVVTWSRATTADEEPVDCYCGCSGVFRNIEAAKTTLQIEEEELIESLEKEFKENEGLEGLEAFKNSLNVAGSPEDEYYQIDYLTANDYRCQWYYRLEQIEFAG